MTPLELKTPDPSEKFEMSSRGGDKLHNYGKLDWKFSKVKKNYNKKEALCVSGIV